MESKEGIVGKLRDLWHLAQEHIETTNISADAGLQLLVGIALVEVLVDIRDIMVTDNVIR